MTHRVVNERNPARKLRADARENREAILAAARAVFAADGLQAPLETIAQEANVGRATMQRRFPTRDDLVIELMRQNMDHLESFAASSRDQPDGFIRFLREIARIYVTDRAFVLYFNQPGTSQGLRNEIANRLINITRGLLTTAQDTQIIRRDITVADVPLLVEMLSMPIHRLGDDQAQALMDRALELMLCGIEVSVADSAPER